MTPGLDLDSGQRLDRGELSGGRYVGSIVAVSALLWMAAAAVIGLRSGAALVLMGPPAIQLGAAIIHLVLRATRRPGAALPQLDPADLGPALASTCLVYPVIVHGSADVDELIATMCAGRADSGDGLRAHVALVDFADSRAPTLDSDSVLRAEIAERLRQANRHIGAPRLLALFRTRRYNPAERLWLGWERKRGKLIEFVDLVSGTAGTSFAVAEPDDRAALDAVRGVHCVITVDVGNRLPDGGARQLVAAMAHPANRPVIDEHSASVVAGFGIIRPIHCPARPRSFLEWAWQPYPSASGDLPFGQQLFGQDLFLGQGIFDVAAVRATLTGRIPDNSVLSHDKLEGMHARTGCVATAVVVEANLGDYLALRQRSHRWIRGDVQLLPWVVGGGSSGRRSLPLLGRWVLVSDVIDHVWPAAMVGLLVLGWLTAPAVGWWTVAGLALLLQQVLVLPLMVLLARPSPRPPQLSRWLWPIALLTTRGRVALWLAQVELLRAPLLIALLADRGVVGLDACVRALFRLTVSRRHLLQWTSSAQASRAVDGAWWVRWRLMRGSWVGSALLTSVIWAVRPAALVWAWPLLLLWLVAPQLAYLASRTAKRLPFAAVWQAPGGIQ